MVPSPQLPSLLLSASPHAHHAAPPAQLFLPDDDRPVPASALAPAPCQCWRCGVGGSPPPRRPAADVHHLRPGLLRFPGRTLSLSLRRTYRPTHLRFITSSLTRRNFPPALAISSVFRVQLHSSSAGRGVFFPPPLPLFLSALFGMWKPSSDDAIFHAPL